MILSMMQISDHAGHEFPALRVFGTSPAVIPVGIEAYSIMNEMYFLPPYSISKQQEIGSLPGIRDQHGGIPGCDFFEERIDPFNTGISLIPNTCFCTGKSPHQTAIDVGRGQIWQDHIRFLPAQISGELDRVENNLDIPKIKP